MAPTTTALTSLDLHWPDIENTKTGPSLLLELSWVLGTFKARGVDALATSGEHERRNLGKGFETPGEEGKKSSEGPKNTDAVELQHRCLKS